MAGRVPIWDSRPAAQAQRADKTETIAWAATRPVVPGGQEDFATMLADETGRARVSAPETPPSPRPFGFGDLLDIVNPLQQIPLVGTVYRKITGDEIQPASRVIGGALYGGVFGAAGGLANVIVEQETGRDISGNLLAMVADEPTRPETRLARATQSPRTILPAAATAFLPADFAAPPETIERVPVAEGRTAGFRQRLS